MCKLTKFCFGVALGIFILIVLPYIIPMDIGLLVFGVLFCLACGLAGAGLKVRR